jgi:hypothetical protein
VLVRFYMYPFVHCCKVVGLKAYSLEFSKLARTAMIAVGVCDFVWVSGVLDRGLRAIGL